MELNKRVDSPIGKVWEAWTDTGIITRWFSPHANIQPELGGGYELFFDPEDHSHMSTIGCVITKIEAPSSLHFQWKGPDQFDDIMNHPEPQTRVEVSFSEEAGKTGVTVRHLGWKKSGKWGEAREWHVKAWKGVLEGLDAYMSGSS